jgi:hypothetical protein
MGRRNFSFRESSNLASVLMNCFWGLASVLAVFPSHLAYVTAFADRGASNLLRF